jgi:hypothetical protein
MHRTAEEGGAPVLGVDRRHRREAPPGRREPDQPTCAASKIHKTSPKGALTVTPLSSFGPGGDNGVTVNAAEGCLRG